MKSRHQSLRVMSESTSPPATYAFHFFISYTTREEEVTLVKPVIDSLVERLKKAGVVVCPAFYDGWYLARREYATHELDGLLTSALTQSAFTLAFVSPGYVGSPWCRFEWNRTEELHTSRGIPAAGHSILPVLWKELPTYYSSEKRLFRRKVDERMGWEGYPGVIPPRARTVNVCDAFGGASITNLGMSSWKLLVAVQEYLERWYPNDDWRAVSGEEL